MVPCTVTLPRPPSRCGRSARRVFVEIERNVFPSASYAEHGPMAMLFAGLSCGRAMVVIHVKRSETDQFLFSTTCAESNDSLIRNLVGAAPWTGNDNCAPHNAPGSRGCARVPLATPVPLGAGVDFQQAFPDPAPCRCHPGAGEARAAAPRGHTWS